MSTIVCLKEGGLLVLGTDSRFMNHVFAGIQSDAVPKITELACGETFIATTGWNFACDFQAGKAGDLGRELNTSDIRLLGEALDRASMPFLQEMTRTLAEAQSLSGHEIYGETLSGTRPLQGFLLAGRSGGEVGYVFYEYWLREGQVVSDRTEYFGAQRQIKITGVDPFALESLGKRQSTWSDDAVLVVRRFLAAAKRTNPHIGGQNQIVLIDSLVGAHWINRIPAMETAGAQLAHATITAAVSMTAPDINVTGSGFTMRMHTSVGLLVSYSVTKRLSVTTTGIAITDTGRITAQTLLNLDQLNLIYGVSGSAIGAFLDVSSGYGKGRFTNVLGTDTITLDGSNGKVSATLFRAGASDGISTTINYEKPGDVAGTITVVGGLITAVT